MKTTIDVDRELADEAASILGTRSLKETVNEALRQTVRRDRLRRLARRVREGTLAAPTPEELAELRAPKVPIGALDGLFDDRRHRA
jgi:Arc/MetJ family transcription regulator